MLKTKNEHFYVRYLFLEELLVPNLLSLITEKRTKTKNQRSIPVLYINIVYKMQCLSTSTQDMTDSCSTTTMSEICHLEDEMRSNGVRFGNIMIRLYDPCVSDNPSCSTGPPIGIDWTYVKFNERALRTACRKSSTSMNFHTMSEKKAELIYQICGSPSTQQQQQQQGSNEEEKLDLSGHSTSSSRGDRDHVRRLSNTIMSQKRHESSSPMCSELVISVDEYEEKRTPRAQIWSDLLIPSEKRIDLLLNCGYTEKEIASWTRQARKVQFGRMQTYHNLRIMSVEERLEKMRRHLKRCVVKDKEKRRTMRSSHLYDQWKNSASQSMPPPSIVS